MRELERITGSQDRMERMITHIDKKLQKETGSAEKDERHIKALERIADALERWEDPIDQ